MCDQELVYTQKIHLVKRKINVSRIGKNQWQKSMAKMGKIIWKIKAYTEIRKYEGVRNKWQRIPQRKGQREETPGTWKSKRWQRGIQERFFHVLDQKQSSKVKPNYADIWRTFSFNHNNTNRFRVLDENLSFAKLPLVSIHVNCVHQMLDTTFYISVPFWVGLRGKDCIPWIRFKQFLHDTV